MSHGQQNLELGPAAYGKWSFKIKHPRLNFEQAHGAFAAVSLGQNLGSGMVPITASVIPSFLTSSSCVGQRESQTQGIRRRWVLQAVDSLLGETDTLKKL